MLTGLETVAWGFGIQNPAHSEQGSYRAAKQNNTAGSVFLLTA